MKCISCGADIPPAWVAAIAANQCPGCAGPIYSDEHKELMEDLRTALTEMKTADAESIAGWLLSNYRLVKIGDAQPTDFHRKPAQAVANGGPMPNMQLKIADNPVQGFLRRAGMTQLSKQKDLAEIARQIQENAAGKGTLYPSGTPEDEVYMDGEEPVAEQYTPAPAVAQAALANNSFVVDPEQPGLTPLSGTELANIQASLAGQNSSSEVDRIIPKELKDARLIKLQKQREALEGFGPANCAVRRSGG